VRYRCFEDWESAAAFLRAERSCDLCGIVAQSRNASAGRAPPSSGGVASAVKAASPRATVAESAHPKGGEVRDYAEVAAAAGCKGSTSAGREHGELPAVEQCTDDAVAEGDEERPSTSTPSSPIKQALENSKEGEACDIKDGTAVEASTPVRRRPFRRSTAFVVGHRNRLEEEALSVCDFLVHIEKVRQTAALLVVLVVWSIQDGGP